MRNKLMLSIAGVFLFAGLASAQSALSMKPGFSVRVNDGLIPAVNTQGIYISDTSIGYYNAQPCYNCGPANTVAIPYPIRAAGVGKVVVITVQLQDIGYTGAPVVSVVATQRGQQILNTSVAFPFTLNGNESALAYFPFQLPNTTGPVFVTAELSDPNGTSFGSQPLQFTIFSF